MQALEKFFGPPNYLGFVTFAQGVTSLSSSESAAKSTSSWQP